jgi:ABC-type cobalamin/Fe3+-siderophores transport system ATPase subunit
MISWLKLKSGSSLDAAPLEFYPKAVTIFIGPNNSGKSHALQEIFSYCQSGQIHQDSAIISGIEFAGVEAELAEQALENIAVPLGPRETCPPGQIAIIGPRGRELVSRDNLLSAIRDPSSLPLKTWFAQMYLARKVLSLTGQTRLNLTSDQQAEELSHRAEKSFGKLFRDDALREKLRNVVHQALGLNLVVDPTRLGYFRLKFAREAPISVEFERALTDASIAYYHEATPIAQASDGVKAFVGILAEIFAGNPEVLLIDEPEAFLHPSLSFSLGNQIASSIAATRKRIFVATHSPQFLMGCIQSGVAIDVVRLTFQKGKPTARILSSDQLVSLMRNPLLRSTGVLGAAFYESAVVTESDSDRAFYQEINERLLRQSGRGIPNCVFINAQNKQTVPIVLDMLRKLGIPSAGIYDIDLIKDGGVVATNFLNSAGVPQPQQQSLSILRLEVLRLLQGKGVDFKRHGADSDEGGHLFQSDRGHPSDLMAAT